MRMTTRPSVRLRTSSAMARSSLSQTELVGASVASLMTVGSAAAAGCDSARPRKKAKSGAGGRPADVTARGKGRGRRGGGGGGRGESWGGGGSWFGVPGLEKEVVGVVEEPARLFAGQGVGEPKLGCGGRVDGERLPQQRHV